MKKNICFNYKMDSKPDERVKLLEDTGFDGVFIYSQYNPREYLDLICKSKLAIETLHLPYKKFENGILIDSQYVNLLWLEGEESNQYEHLLIEEIKLAHSYGINKVVAHITGGSEPPPMGEAGVNHISNILNYCEKYGMYLCLENLRRLDYLEFIYKRIVSERLKFCFDTGHANTFTKNVINFPWNIVDDKLMCVHLNDNDGLNDMHIVPFQGNIDWNELLPIMYSHNSQLELTLEVRCSKEQRIKYTEREYLQLCFDSLVKIENIIKQKDSINEN